MEMDRAVFYGGDGVEGAGRSPFGGKGDNCMGMVSRNRRHEWEAALMRGFSTVYCPGLGLKGNGTCEAFPFLMFFERLCPRLCRCLRYNYLKLLRWILCIENSLIISIYYILLMTRLRKWQLLFSLRFQRNNRQNALIVDSAKGKIEEKGRIFTVLRIWNSHMPWQGLLKKFSWHFNLLGCVIENGWYFFSWISKGISNKIL